MVLTPDSVRSGGLARCMLENLTTGVLLFDAGLRLLAMNPAAEVLLGLSAGKLVGAEAAGIFGAAEEAGAEFVQGLASGLPFTKRELHLRLGSGHAVLVDCTVTPVEDAAVEGAVLIELVQVDQHKRITHDEQMAAQGESVRALLRGLAHEIRNPLSGLRGAAQLLEQEVHDAGVREYTDVIIREADRLQRLLDRMLGPRALPRLRCLNVHEVTERVRTLIQAEAPPGLAVVADYDPSLPAIHADAEMLIQATLNLARNAVQALAGQGRLTLRTRVHRQLTIGQRRHRLVVAIDVCDDGPGVAAELRELLFYPMVSGRAEGSGLGLSIAQSIVKQHGGVIEWHSEPGDTTFSLLLPLADAR